MPLLKSIFSVLIMALCSNSVIALEKTSINEEVIESANITSILNNAEEISESVLIQESDELAASQEKLDTANTRDEIVNVVENSESESLDKDIDAGIKTGIEGELEVAVDPSSENKAEREITQSQSEEFTLPVSAPTPISTPTPIEILTPKVTPTPDPTGTPIETTFHTGVSINTSVITQENTKQERFIWGTLYTYYQGNSVGTENVLTAVAVVNRGMQIHQPHTHPEEEYLMVLEGNGIWTIKGREFPAKPGDMLYAAPNELHGIRNTGDVPLKFVVFKWNSKLIQDQ